MTNKEIQILVMLEVIAPEDGKSDLSEEIRSEIRERFKHKLSWDEIFEPAPKTEQIIRIIDLLKTLDNEENI